MANLRGYVLTTTIILSALSGCGGTSKTFDYSTLPDNVQSWDNIKRCTAPENTGNTSCNTYKRAVTF